MLKVAPLIKHLSENNPQQTPARLTFFNYLTHMVDPEAMLSDEVVENFFASSLDYAHWQQNKSQLGREIQLVLEQYAQLSNTEIDLSGIRWPQDTQIVEIDNLKDLTDAIQVYLNSVYRKQEKYRLVLDQDKKIIAIVLHADHSLSVRCFDRKMIIRHGQLEPLRKDIGLFYNSDLELDPEKTQKLEVAPYVTAQFKTGHGELRGALVRGYICQKFFDLRGESLQSHPKLFYAVKRLEQHFINRQTDPFYNENLTALERMIELVRQSDPESLESSMDVLAKAQNALENVFIGDKLLSLLIRDLQHTLAAKSSNQRIVATTNRKAENTWEQPLQATIPTIQNPSMKRSTPTSTEGSTTNSKPMTQNSTSLKPATPNRLQERIQERKFDLTN